VETFVLAPHARPTDAGFWPVAPEAGVVLLKAPGSCACSAARKSNCTSSRPPDATTPFHCASFVTFASISVLSPATVSCGWLARRSAAAPAT
jgi:hypothetical protein